MNKKVLQIHSALISAPPFSSSGRTPWRPISSTLEFIIWHHDDYKNQTFASRHLPKRRCAVFFVRVSQRLTEGVGDARFVTAEQFLWVSTQKAHLCKAGTPLGSRLPRRARTSKKCPGPKFYAGVPTCRGGAGDDVMRIALWVLEAMWFYEWNGEIFDGCVKRLPGYLHGCMVFLG